MCENEREREIGFVKEHFGMTYLIGCVGGRSCVAMVDAEE